MQAWLSVAFYMYAVAKEHGDGEYYRENVYVVSQSSANNNITDFHDLVNATEEEREEFRKTVAQNLATAFNMPELAKGFKKQSYTESELRRREMHSLLQEEKQ